MRGVVRLHGDIQGPRRNAWEGVFRLVRRIPRGRVMTYGQIATLLGSRLSPRAVGWALHGCPRGVPWQRVVNASGGCSTERLPDIAPGLQRALLESEGVRFRAAGTLDLAAYRWTPARPSARRPGRPAAPRLRNRRS
jgi:methylated-DNA-protein-cysteine methyltransferase-like protein